MNKSILLISTFLQVISGNSLMAMEDDSTQTTITPSQLKSLFPSQERGEKRKRETIKEEKKEANKEEKQTKKLKTENDIASHNLAADEMAQDNRPDYLISPELNEMPIEILHNIFSYLKENNKTLYSLLQVNKKFCSELQPLFVLKAKEDGFIPIKYYRGYRGDKLSQLPERAGSRFYTAHDCLKRAWKALMDSAIQSAELKRPNVVYDFGTLRLISACDKGVAYLYPNSSGSKFLNYLTQAVYTHKFNFLRDNPSLEREILGDKLSNVASPPENIYEEGIPSWLVWSLLSITPGWEELKSKNVISVGNTLVNNILHTADSNIGFPTNLARMHLNSKEEWAKLENSSAPLEERLEILEDLLEYLPVRTGNNLRFAAKLYREAFDKATTAEQKRVYVKKCKDLLCKITEKYGANFDDARNTLYIYLQAREHGMIDYNSLFRKLADHLMKAPNKTLNDLCTAAYTYKHSFFTPALMQASDEQRLDSLIKEIIQIAHNNNNLDELREITSFIKKRIGYTSAEAYLGLGTLHDQILQHQDRSLQDLALAANHYCLPLNDLDATHQRSCLEKGLKLADEFFQGSAKSLSDFEILLLSRYRAFSGECFNMIEKQGYLKEFIVLLEHYSPSLLPDTNSSKDLRALIQIRTQCETAYSAAGEEEDKRKCVNEIISLSEFILKDDFKEIMSNDQIAAEYEHISYFYAKAGDKVSALNYLKAFLATDTDEFESDLYSYSDNFSMMDALWEGHENDPAYKKYLKYKNSSSDSEMDEED